MANSMMRSAPKCHEVAGCGVAKAVHHAPKVARVRNAVKVVHVRNAVVPARLRKSRRTPQSSNH
jgi:hypothetical protein